MYMMIPQLRLMLLALTLLSIAMCVDDCLYYYDQQPPRTTGCNPIGSQNLSIVCKACAPQRASVEIQWYMDKKKIIEGNARIIVRHVVSEELNEIQCIASHLMILNNITLQECGEYLCEIVEEGHSRFQPSNGLLLQESLAAACLNNQFFVSEEYLCAEIYVGSGVKEEFRSSPVTPYSSDQGLNEPHSAGSQIENDSTVALAAGSRTHGKQDVRSSPSSNAPSSAGLSTFVEVSVAIIVVLSLIVIILFGILAYCAYKICGHGGIRIEAMPNLESDIRSVDTGTELTGVAKVYSISTLEDRVTGAEEDLFAQLILEEIRKPDESQQELLGKRLGSR